jgi:hypothetical protein
MLRAFVASNRRIICRRQACHSIHEPWLDFLQSCHIPGLDSGGVSAGYAFFQSSPGTAGGRALELPIFRKVSAPLKMAVMPIN